MNTLRLVHAALDAAAEEGMILDEEDQAELENNIQQMQETAASNGYSYSAYLNAIYGSVMTTEDTRSRVGQPAGEQVPHRAP